MNARGGIVAGAVLASLVAACGGGTTSTSTSTSSSQATSSTSNQNVATDRAVAQQAVLRLSDFPAGWEAKAHQDSPDNPDVTKQAATCLHVSPSALSSRDNKTHVDSPDFSSSSEQEVSNSVALDATATEAISQFAAFEQPQAPNCLTQAVSAVIQSALKHPTTGSTLPQGVKIGQASVNALSFPNFGDKTVAFRMTVPVQASGLNVSVYVDIVLLLKGRAGSTLTFEDTLSPFPTDQAEQLTQIVAGRLPST
jgi:hypothetical protein